MKKILLLIGACIFSNYVFAQAPGDIIITEFMANPDGSESTNEYIEFYNKRSVSFDLDGFIVKDDGSDSFTISGSLVIPAESFIVVAKSSDPLGNGSNVADYVYSGGSLVGGSSGDEIVLTNPSGTEIARLIYSISSTGGTSKELDAISNVESNGVIDDSHFGNSVTSITGGTESNGSPGSAGSTDLTETPTIRFTASSGTSAETAGAVNIDVILEDADGNTVDVDVVYNEGSSSTEPSDFSSINTVSLSFSTASDGDETKSASFTIVSDTDYEGAEFGFFELSNLSTSGTTIFNVSGDSTYTLNITDDDAPSVVINEVNPDPEDDANGDTMNSTESDEFVEIYNNEEINIDISDWSLIDLNGTIHEFSSGTIIKAKSAIVIFDDSGTPAGTFGGSTVLTSTSDLSLNNSNEKIVLLDNQDIRLDSVSYTTGPSNESLTRNPDGTGSFVDHTTANASLTISPGTKLDGSTFTTDIVIEGTAGWRLLSVPMENYDITEISDDTPIQGITNGDGASGDANIYYYDDSGAWEEPATTTTQYPEGYGLALYFFNNDDNSSLHLPVTLDVSGSEPSSDVNAVSLSSTVTGGSYYTLVGNPFASNYSLNSITADDGDGIQNNVHFWDNSASSYEAVDRTGPSIVSSWQGFWVEVVNDGSETTAISFPTSGKSFSSITDFHFSKALDNKGDINFTLSSKNSFDKALRLSFRNDAIVGLDKSDASKLTPLISEYATMAFKSNERLKSVESLPWNLEEEIKLDLEEQLVGVSGEFTFDWKGLESIPSDWKLTLHDYEKGTSLDMRTESEYRFEASASVTEKVNPLNILTGPAAVTQKSKSAGTRFAITITPSTNSVSNETDSKVTEFALDQNYPNPFNPSTTINYSVKNSGAVNISVYNLMGQKVAELVNETKSAGSYNVTWNASEVSSGMYYYRLEAGGQSLTRKMTLIK